MGFFFLPVLAAAAMAQLSPAEEPKSWEGGSLAVQGASERVSNGEGPGQVRVLVGGGADGAAGSKNPPAASGTDGASRSQAQGAGGGLLGRERFEFATGYTEAVKEFDLPLANSTGKPVKMLSVETSCTCMKVTVPEPVIAPGATGRVHCVFTVPNATGTIQKPVILKTDSAERPKELAMVRVDVPSELVAEPERLAWSVGEPTEEKTLRIKVADEGVLHVLGVKCSRDLFEWSLQTIRDGREYELRVKPKNTAAPALGMFLVQTDSIIPRQKTRSIYAVIEPPKRASGWGH